MNSLQFVAILLYIIVIVTYLYFTTNKFEKGWVRNLLLTSKYKNASGGYIYFRFIAAGIVVSLVLTLKCLGTT